MNLEDPACPLHQINKGFVGFDLNYAESNGCAPGIQALVRSLVNV